MGRADAINALSKAGADVNAENKVSGLALIDWHAFEH